MAKRVTIQHLADELNTTPSTVSRALRDHPSISVGMKKRVRDLAILRNYQVNSIAANLRSGQSKTIGVIVPRINRDFFSNVIAGIEEVANKQGYGVVICQTHDELKQEANCIEALLRARVDCILISISLETRGFEHFKKVIDMNVPLVFFDRVQESSKTIRIVNNDEKGAFVAVNHLIEQGYKRIAHFTGPGYINIYRNRKEGYLKALKENDIPIDKNLIIENKLDYQAGYDGMRQVMKLSNPPDALFSSSDYAALGAINWLKDNNYKIPNDFGLVGYSNEKFTSHISPSLTTLDQHSLEMGKYAANVFFDRFKSEDRDFILNSLSINPKLIIRESSKRKRKV